MKFHQASLCREPYSTAQKVDAVAGFGDAASNVGGHGEGESCFGKLFCSQTSWCVASWCTQHQVFKRFLFLPLRACHNIGDVSRA